MITYLVDKSPNHTMSDIVGIDVMFIQNSDPNLEGWYWAYRGECSFNKVDSLINAYYEGKKIVSLDVINYLAYCYRMKFIGKEWC